MKRADRLSEESPNPLTRALLRAGQGDRPSATARRNTAAALGVAAGATGLAAATGTAGATGAATASKWIGGVGILKWVGAAVTTSAIAVGAAHHYTSLPREEAYSPRVSAPLPAPSARAKAPSRAATTEPPSAPPPVQSAAPAAPAVQSATRRDAPLESAPAVPAHRAPAPSLEDTSLRAETDALDRARSALASGDASRALTMLDAYARAFPNAVLADEAAVLRLDALANAGMREDAIREGRAWLTHEPSSPHAAHVRRALRSLGAETP